MTRDASAMPVSELRGVGPSVAEKLARVGVENVQDLLFHLPARYEDRTRVTPIGALRAGEHAVVEATVELTEVAFGRRRTLLVRIADGTGSLLLRFFHFSGAQQNALARGLRVRVYGEARRGKASLEMVHPEYRAMRADDAGVPDSLTPVYPSTEGVQQPRWRTLTDQALDLLRRDAVLLPEFLPHEVLARLQLPTLHAALALVHRPPADADAAALLAGRHPAQRRLAFEELLAQHMSLRLVRQRADHARAPVLKAGGRLVNAYIESLPFALTGAQRRVLDEIFADLKRARPMMRLVQGDVGSGKTVVAAAAALRAVECGCQAVLMAPTELLAEQHFRNFDQWLQPLGIVPEFFAGRVKGKARAALLARMAAGDTPIVVGTHALFQDEVAFQRLALVIVDEQHRFGVHQRLALREKGQEAGWRAHQLIMTATPIPRTLAMSAYADLDNSVIDEMPPGRPPLRTVVLPEGRRDEVVARVHAACAAGRQVYWVCPLIEESDTLEAQAAERTAETLAAALPDVRVGLVHGRLKPEVRGRTMQAFKDGALDMLVATTVIEVGVDVPNATLMVIENAERMGLAQLHQLRGRVGRGSEASACVLMYRAPLSALARERLGVLRDSNDGFEIAAEDLRLRGPGEVLGTKQTGIAQMRIADLVRDADLLPRVQQAADMILLAHPDRAAPLVRRWHGGGERYASV
ncbi:MAG: ATP-dependent DNA helicase RecG [Xanthomonadaceae bacterium]|nr:ATP-dependent DNA helicase RecG [Xanthomonadaceae bacterium]